MSDEVWLGTSRSTIFLESSEQSDRAGFQVSLLDLVLLYLIDSEPTTGYILKKKLTDQFRLRSSFGTLYPRLKVFEKEGIVKIIQHNTGAQLRNSGIHYEITLKGKLLLAENLRAFNGFLQRVKDGVL